MDETVRYTYRLRPGATARAALLLEWGRCRWLWNEAVHQQKTGRKPTFGKLSKLLTHARGRSGWLRDGSQVAQQQTLRTYAQALDHSYKLKGRGRPKVKRRKDTLPSLEYTLRGFILRHGRLRLAGNIVIPLVNRGLRAGRKVVLVPPAYTTMTCSQCATRTKERLGLGVRTFRCGRCGYTACRDRNAARTILATVERDRAGADDVRHGITSLQDGDTVRSEPEIPRLSTVGKR